MDPAKDQESIELNLDLVTLDLAATCDLVTILLRPVFNLLHKIIRFSNIMPDLKQEF